MTDISGMEAGRVWIADGTTAVTLPTGWSVVEGAEVPTVRGPEGDIEVGFVVLQEASSDDDTVARAWGRSRMPDELDLLQFWEQPAADGWERVSQRIYRVRGREDQMAMAIMRVFGGRAHVNLVVASRAGLDRRMAHMMQLLQGWRAVGLQAENISGRTARKWGRRERDAMGAFMIDAMTVLDIPGAALAVVQGGRIVECRGFGRCGMDAPEPVSGDTRFMIGSSTKPLTTLMMARLVGQGRFAWSTPVTQLLPEFALADAQMTRRLDMRHTVSASTGLPRNDMEIVFRADGLDPERSLARMRQLQPTTGFGETFQYSNQLVAVGGFAAASAYAPGRPLGAAYRKVMRDEVFAPLRMDRTLLRRPRSRLAWAHALGHDGVTQPIDMSLETFVDAVAPAGAVWSTARDMARYLQMELAGGRDGQGGTYMARELLEQRYESQVRIGDKSSYGLGLMRSIESGLDVLGHNGNTLGFSTDMWFVPGHDFGVIVLTNRGASNAFLAATRKKVLELMFDAEAKAEAAVALAKRNRDAAMAAHAQRMRMDDGALEWIGGFVGDYVSQALGSMRIQRDVQGYRMHFQAWSSALAVDASEQGSWRLALIDPPWSGSMQLSVEEDGCALVLAIGQQRHTFRRQPDERQTP